MNNEQDKGDAAQSMLGLSDVDYSDIQAEFDDLSYARSTSVFSGINGMDHMPNGGFGILHVREKGGGLIAEVKRAESKIYGYKISPNRKSLQQYGQGRIGKGFVDAIMSVSRDKDVYDPQTELDLFLKYQMIRADFVGGQCPSCKGHKNYLLSINSARGYIYRYKCMHCRGQYTPKSGTLFHGCRIELPKLMDCIRMSLDPAGISSFAIADQINVTQGTAWNLRRLMRDNSITADRWPGEIGADVKSRIMKVKAPVIMKSLYDLQTLIP